MKKQVKNEFSLFDDNDIFQNHNDLREYHSNNQFNYQQQYYSNNDGYNKNNNNDSNKNYDNIKYNNYATCPTYSNKIINNKNNAFLDKNSFCNGCINNFIQCEKCKGYFKIMNYYDKHENLCNKLHEIYRESQDLIDCNDCKSIVKFHNYEKHKQNCPSLKKNIELIKCDHCCIQFPLDMIDEHEIQCENKLSERMLLKEKIECSFCKESVPFSVIELHETTCLKLKENQEKVEKMLLETDVEYPLEWGILNHDLEINCLYPENDGWKFCEDLLKRSVNQAKVTNVQLIKNKYLWEKYAREKIRITNEKGKCDENFLFHGTRNNDPKIVYTTGFDISFSNDGGSYGRGIYFARRADYSASSYAYMQGGKNYLFLAKVLTGMCIQIPGNPSLRKPPFYDQSSFIYYDSVTNFRNDNNNYDISQMIIVYNNEKAYPYYLIEYTYSDGSVPIKMRNNISANFNNIYNHKVNLLKQPYVNPNYNNNNLSNKKKEKKKK